MIYGTILLLGAITLATRLAGPLIIGAFEDSPGLRRFLEAMSAGVLSALVASQLVQGGPREWLAMAVAALVTWITRSAAIALISSAAAAAIWTAVA